jgi:hypothetical protein
MLPGPRDARCHEIAAVAVARELVGFLWAAMMDLEATHVPLNDAA